MKHDVWWLLGQGQVAITRNVLHGFHIINIVLKNNISIWDPIRPHFVFLLHDFLMGCPCGNGKGLTLGPSFTHIRFPTAVSYCPPPRQNCMSSSIAAHMGPVELPTQARFGHNWTCHVDSDKPVSLMYLFLEKGRLNWQHCPYILKLTKLFSPDKYKANYIDTLSSQRYLLRLW